MHISEISGFESGEGATIRMAVMDGIVGADTQTELVRLQTEATDGFFDAVANGNRGDDPARYAHAMLMVSSIISNLAYQAGEEGVLASSLVAQRSAVDILKERLADTQDAKLRTNLEASITEWEASPQGQSKDLAELTKSVGQTHAKRATGSGCALLVFSAGLLGAWVS